MRKLKMKFRDDKFSLALVTMVNNSKFTDIKWLPEWRCLWRRPADDCYSDHKNSEAGLLTFLTISDDVLNRPNNEEWRSTTNSFVHNKFVIMTKRWFLRQTSWSNTIEYTLSIPHTRLASGMYHLVEFHLYGTLEICIPITYNMTL